MNENKLKILFLCTENSCRSQMTEGFARHLKSDRIDGYSAGTVPKGVDPMAVKAMTEIGIDISRQKSTSIDEIKSIEFDYVITLCDNAQKTCPTFPAKTSVMHFGFEDPPKLAENARTEEEAMQHYRRVMGRHGAVSCGNQDRKECLFSANQILSGRTPGALDANDEQQHLS